MDAGRRLVHEVPRVRSQEDVLALLERATPGPRCELLDEEQRSDSGQGEEPEGRRLAGSPDSAMTPPSVPLVVARVSNIPGHVCRDVASRAMAVLDDDLERWPRATTSEQSQLGRSTRASSPPGTAPPRVVPR